MFSKSLPLSPLPDFFLFPAVYLFGTSPSVTKAPQFDIEPQRLIASLFQQLIAAAAYEPHGYVRRCMREWNRSSTHQPAAEHGAAHALPLQRPYAPSASFAAFAPANRPDV